MKYPFAIEALRERAADLVDMLQKTASKEMYRYLARQKCEIELAIDMLVEVGNIATPGAEDEKDAAGKGIRDGDPVTFVTEHKREHGIVKGVPDGSHAFVVYNCNGDWDNYRDYTAARTRLSDLVKGWK